MSTMRIDTNANTMGPVLYYSWTKTNVQLGPRTREWPEWEDLTVPHQDFWKQMSRNLVQAYILGSAT
jgi:hypothetical protein